MKNRFVNPFYRKFDGKIKTATAFCLLLGQKFMSLLVTKLLLFGELPSLKDQTFLLLLGIHFTTFLCFHSTPVKGFMERYRKSEYRKLVQETFKGYGKGFSLLVLVNKGFKLQIQPVYFIFILVIRGTASSLYKSATLSYLLNKPFKLKKPR